MQKNIEIGKIVGTRGLDGTLKLLASGEKTQFVNLHSVLILNKEYKIKKISKVKNFYFLKLDEVTSINDAELLKDNFVFVDRNNIKLEKDEYLICDMIGLEVFDDNEKFWGIITEIENYGSKDVYTMKNNNKEIDFCLIDGLIKQVDFDKNKLILDANILSEVIVWKLIF